MLDAHVQAGSRHPLYVAQLDTCLTQQPVPEGNTNNAKRRVMSAWGKANNVRGDDIVGQVGETTISETLTYFRCQLFMSDADTSFSKKLGWTKGERTSRYAMIIDHGKVTYAENEPGGDVTVSRRRVQGGIQRHPANALK